jgi:FkbH-like protein
MNIKFPIDPSKYIFKENYFSKESKKYSIQYKYKVKFIGGYTQSHTINWLEIFSRYSGILTETIKSDWGSGYNLISSPNIFDNNPDLLVVFLLPQDFYPQSRADISYINFEQIKLNLYHFADNCQSKKINIVFSLLESDFITPPVGGLKNDSLLSLSVKLNQIITEICDFHNNVLSFSMTNICSGFECENITSPRDWYAFGTPFNINASFFLGNYLKNLIRGFLGMSQKVLVSDLDNTLWGGIIGDDGPSKIKIGSDTPEGRIFLDIQIYILNLIRRGVYVSIASKNEEHLALEGFMRDDSILKADDFASLEINWNNKSKSIRSICNQLNVGLDSVFFRDDNPSEREEVASSCSEVVVPNVSDDPFTFLQALKFYDPFCIYLKPLQEDMTRNSSIKSRKIESEILNEAMSYDEFLKSILIKLKITIINEENFDRSLQLNNKTNQFNFTSQRLKAKNLSEIIKNDKNINITYSVSDKFTNYGLTGIIFLNIQNNILVVNNWLMSCRVFNKTLEIAMLEKITKIAKDEKLSKIIMKYIPTKRNQLILTFFKENGIQKVNNILNNEEIQEWEFDLNNKIEFKHHVEIIS